MGSDDETVGVARPIDPVRSQFSKDLDGTKDLKVDVAHLDQIKTYLETVAKAVEDHLLPKLDEVDREFAYGRGGVNDGTALGSGQIANASTLAGRHDSTYRAVKTSVEGMAKSFRDAARVIGKFATEYDTVEERNNAGVSALDWRA
jgi:hypothetical protein